MNKTIASAFILALTIILSIVFYNMTVDNYPEFGGFYNLLFLGLTLFFFGVGVFVSALTLGKGIREGKS